MFEKIYGARQAGVTRVFVPKENEKDIPVDLDDIEVIPVTTVREIVDLTLAPAKPEKVVSC